MSCANDTLCGLHSQTVRYIIFCVLHFRHYCHIILSVRLLLNSIYNFAALSNISGLLNLDDNVTLCSIVTESIETLLKTMYNMWSHIAKKLGIHDDNMAIMWQYIVNFYVIFDNVIQFLALMLEYYVQCDEIFSWAHRQL